MTPNQRARAVLAAAENDAAHEYAAMLRVGSELLDDVDGPIIGWYRHRIPQALSRRGLCLEPIPGGWRVVAAPIAPPVARVVPRAQCRCGLPWFDCPCTAPALEIPW